MNDALPLTGRRVVVTRVEDLAAPLARALRALGAEPILAPAIRSAPAPDAGALRAAVRRLPGARWLCLTSPTGVRHGWPVVAAAWPGGLPAGVGVAALGPGTAAALRAQGAPVDFQPDEPSGDAFAAELPVAPGDRVVLLRSDIAREAVAGRLRARGADVLNAVAYRTLPADPAAVGRALDARPDAVAFTSPSTVRGFLAGVEGPGHLEGVALVPIGPTTAGAIEAAGLRPAALPSAPTLDGLLTALVRLLA